MKAERTKTKLVLSLLALGSTLTFIAFCMADDIAPGLPSAPTIRTEAQPILELPYTISEPGSYCLTQNLTHTDRYTNAIVVEANNVTIDLGGYSLIGPTSSFNETCSGIYMDGRTNVEIHNGTITNFPYIGIYEADSGEFIQANGHRIIDVRITSIGAEGIFLQGLNHTVRGCTVTQTQLELDQGYGAITCGHISIVSNNVVSENRIVGIQTAIGCLVRDNTIANCSHGIVVREGSSVVDNTISYIGETGGNGISIVDADGCLVRGNTIRKIAGYGINIESYDCVIEGNLVSSCDVGIYFVYNENVYANNRALYNGTNYGGQVPSGVYDGGGNIAAGTLVGGSVGASLQLKAASRTQEKMSKK
jgi:parallel beta-helix repeat protein